jgi:hypothetical protein
MYMLLRALALGGGMVIAFAAIFAHEREERLVQQKLEEWWVHLDDSADRAIRAHARAEAIAAVHIAEYLDRMFGSTLPSTRAVAAAVAYAAASASMVVALAISRSWQCELNCGWLMVKHGIAIATMVACGVVAGLRPRLSIIAGVLALVSFVVCVRFTDRNSDVFTLLAIVAVSASLILAWVAIAKRTLRWLGRSDNLMVRIVVALVHLTAAPVFVLGPPTIGALLAPRQEGEGAIFAVGLLAGCALLFVGIVSLAFVGAIVTHLCHRLMWRIADRPLYAAQRHNLLVTHRLKLATLGTAMAAAAFPGAATLLSRLPW